MRVLERWHFFWFQRATPSRLGLCRVVFFGGCLLLYGGQDAAAWAEVSSVFWMPIWAFEALGLEAGSPDLLALLDGLWMAALLLAALGLATRISTATAFLVGAYLLGLPNNFGKAHHFDTVVVLTLGIMALSRCGDAWSLDRAIARKRGPRSPPGPSGEYTWPIRAVWLTLALVFFAAGIAKIRHGGLAWVFSDNLAIKMLAAVHGVGNADPIAAWSTAVASWPVIPAVLAGLTVTTELFYPAALVSRTARWILVPAAVAMLLSIRALMGPTFGTFILCHIFWIPWDELVTRWSEPMRTIIASGSGERDAAPSEARSIVTRWPVGVSLLACATALVLAACGQGEVATSPPPLVSAEQCGSGAAAGPAAPRPAATGPLRPHPINPRYFANADGRPVLLVGSHHWLNLQHRPNVADTHNIDFNQYVACLERLGHNFIRLWMWEDARNTPLPWERTGPGEAADGGLRFDLRTLNEEYFQRLTDRVETARRHGFYVGIMMFQGWSVESKQPGRVAWKLHPFRSNNNVNDIHGDLDGDGEGREVHTLADRRITDIQEAYVRRLVATLNPFDNILWEISNESHGDSWAWQAHMTRLVRSLEAQMPQQHPVGQTPTWPRHINLEAGSADWISPGPRDGDYATDPPVADGRKVRLADSDHLPGDQDADWVWKSFFRGLNPILMDPLHSPDAEPTRHDARIAMGRARSVAAQVDLDQLIPSRSCASTEYCLAHTWGHEYLIYVPDGSVTISLSSTDGRYRVEWLDTTEGAFRRQGSVAGGTELRLRAPRDGRFVLHLIRE